MARAVSAGAMQVAVAELAVPVARVGQGAQAAQVERRVAPAPGRAAIRGTTLAGARPAVKGRVGVQALPAASPPVAVSLIP